MSIGRSTGDTVEEVVREIPAESAKRHSSKVVLALAIFGALAPSVVGLISILKTPWWPTMDFAIEYLRSTDVGTAHTPLVGAYSRFGFNHPGPAMFYLYAPFVHGFGPKGMFVASWLLVVACSVGIIVLARRRCGPIGPLLGAGLILLLLHSVTVSNAFQGWNPFIGTFPLAFAFFCAWSVCAGEIGFYPLLIVTGTFCVQSHLGYAAVVLLLCAAPIVVFLSRHRTRIFHKMLNHRWAVGSSIVVAVALWLPPIIEQFQRNPGNFTLILRNLGQPTEASVSLTNALRIMSAFYAPTGAWLGSGIGTRTVIPAASPLLLLIVCGFTLTLGIVAARVGARTYRTIAIMSVIANIVGVWAISHVQGLVAPYLVCWALVISAVTLFSLVASIVEIFRSPFSAKPDRTRQATTTLLSVSAVALLAFSAFAIPSATKAMPPYPKLGLFAREMADAVAPHLDQGKTYELDWVEVRFINTEAGFIAGIEANHRRVALPPTYLNIITYGSNRVLKDPSQSAGTLHVYPLIAPAADFVPAPGEKVVVHVDRVSRATWNEFAKVNAELAQVKQNIKVHSDRWKAANKDAIVGLSPLQIVGKISAADPQFREYGRENQRLHTRWQNLGDEIARNAYIVTLSPPAA